MEKMPLLLFFLAHVWVDISQGILPVTLPKLQVLFALSYFEVGLLMTVLNLTASVIQPLFGYISDRLRTGWFVPAGILLTSLSMGLLGWAPTYVAALLFVGFAGLGAAAFHPRAMMAVFLMSGSRRGFGGAIFHAGGNLGFALGPLVGSFLILGFGLHATLGLLVPGLILALVFILYPSGDLKREAPDRAAPGEVLHDDFDPIPWVSLIVVCVIVTLRSWVYQSFITYLPMFLQNRGYTLKAGSLTLTVFLIGGAVAGLYGGHLSDRIGRRSVLAASMLLYPLFMSLFLKSSGIWFWPLALASGAALLASFSVTVVLIQELLPRHLGLASGLSLGLGFGTGGLGTALSGYLADTVGLNQTTWILALVPLAAVLLTPFIKTKP